MPKLGDICVFQSGGTPSRSNASYYKGEIPWITTVSLTGGIIGTADAVEFITEQAIKESAAKIVPAYSIMVGTRVGVGKVAINSVPMSTSQDIISLLSIDEAKWDKEFLCKFIIGKSPYLNSQARGATIKGIKIETLANLEVPDISLDEQKHIAHVLNEVNTQLHLRTSQLEELDKLVKSRFIELFGDPVCNEKGWSMTALSEMAEIRIGPFGTLLHKEDYISGGHALVNPSHIVDGKICVDTNLSVSDEKYEELAAYHLSVGDIVLGRRGEMGRCAVVYEEGLLCGTGSLIIRPNNKMHPYFLKTIISSPTFKKTIEDKAVGVTMLNLNVPIVSSLVIPQLPITMQEQFIEFMEHTDKLKLAVTEALTELETLKKSLMQQYFG